jgi:Protein of unknown function (DUF2752)
MNDSTPQPTHNARPSRGGRGLYYVMAVLAVAGLVYLWAVDPERSRAYPQCLFHQITGLHCPGCGATRAVHALLHGHLIDALRFNPLLVIGVPLAAIAVARRSYATGRLDCPPISGRAVLFVLLLFATLRNIPGPMSGLLAPPENGSASEPAELMDPPADGETAERPSGQDE